MAALILSMMTQLAILVTSTATYKMMEPHFFSKVLKEAHKIIPCTIVHNHLRQNFLSPEWYKKIIFELIETKRSHSNFKAVDSYYAYGKKGSEKYDPGGDVC